MISKTAVGTRVRVRTSHYEQVIYGLVKFQGSTFAGTKKESLEPVFAAAPLLLLVLLSCRCSSLAASNAHFPTIRQGPF